VLPSMRPARRIMYRGMHDTLFGDDENAQVGILASLSSVTDHSTANPRNV